MDRTRKTNPETTQLLSAKLHIPPVRSQLVPRLRLIRQLDQGLQRTPGVTLVAAPAGFGKTTLVSTWLAGCARPAAFVALPIGLAEIAFPLWLLIKGVSLEQWEKRALVPA